MLVLTRSVLSLIPIPFDPSVSTQATDAGVRSSGNKASIYYILFFSLHIVDMKFPTPCTYTAPNVFGGYCPVKREAPAYTMHGRNFTPIPKAGTVTEYLAYCTSSLHQTKVLNFFSLYEGLELGLSPILLAVECLVR